MPDLNILIPARNEMFLAKTIEDILEHSEGDTEVIAVLDGAWAEPPIPDHERVTLVYHSQPVGQRAATNEAARLSQAEFVMKCDAHCSFAQGFDVALMADCEPDWTVVPQMRNLHAFDWECSGCGKRAYQGPKPPECQVCRGTDFQMALVWKPRAHTRSNFMRFDGDLHFQYWRAYKKRPESRGDLADTMSLLGACFMMRRERFWELGGLDERHGSWGQMGTEVACKSWLSGGRLVVNKKTWFAHMFRTQSGFKFPYPLTSQEVNQARAHSRWLWLDGNWEGAVHPLEWLLDRFYPVPGWHDSKGVVYYTDNRLDGSLFEACQKQIKTACNGVDIISVSLEPTGLGRNVVLEGERGPLTMFRQILKGLEESTADIIFLCEHDVLYHASHFEFIPPRADTFYYNVNVWKVRLEDGHALKVDDCRQTSGLCAYRELLLDHYRERVRRVEAEGYTQRMGFEPGTHNRAERVDDYGSDVWRSKGPNVDIRHGGNYTLSRWSKEEFRNQKYTKGWTEADEVPGWGRLGDVLDGLLSV